MEPTGHVRSTSRPRLRTRGRYPAARPTQRHLASGAGGRVASSLYRRTADRRGHQRRSATMVARPSTPAAAGSPLSRSLPPERSRREGPFRSSRSRKGGVRNREAPSGGGLTCTTLALAQARAPLSILLLSLLICAWPRGQVRGCVDGRAAGWLVVGVRGWWGRLCARGRPALSRSAILGVGFGSAT